MKEPLDILIKGALIYDGEGGDPFATSIGIKGQRMVHVGEALFESKTVIDAEGLCLCPGFIDTHGHSDFSLLTVPNADSKILQGVTTEINGNCGLSAAPLLGKAKIRREEDIRELRIHERWSAFDEYFDILKQRKPAINYATLTGHGNIRASVKGYSDSKAGEGDMVSMVGLFKDSLEAGSLGLSTGLIYPPGVFTGTEELIGLLMPLRDKHTLIYATHMRSETDRLIEAIEEALRIGEQTGIKVHISHLKTAGKENWHKADKALELIDHARETGIDVTFDRYPYTGGYTDLDTVLPPWAYEGGKDSQLERMRNKVTREKLVGYMRSRLGDGEEYGSIIVSSVVTEKNRWTEGKSILEISASLKSEPAETIIDLLIEEDLRVGAIFMSMSEDNLRKFLAHPLCMVGSDSAVRSFGGVTAKGKPHPRGFGSFPRFLGKYAIKEGLTTLTEGIRKITSFPAGTFGLKGRGVIKEGNFADIVIFDPGRIMDRADYDDPFQKPDGIEYVIVNGNITVSKGEIIPVAGAGMILGGGGASPI